jgi:adenine-specific DNA methylase
MKKEKKLRELNKFIKEKGDNAYKMIDVEDVRQFFKKQEQKHQKEIKRLKNGKQR